MEGILCLADILYSTFAHLIIINFYHLLKYSHITLQYASKLYTEITIQLMYFIGCNLCNNILELGQKCLLDRPDSLPAV